MGVRAKGLIINREMLRRELALALSRQSGWLAAGLLPQLAVAVYTLTRRWTLDSSARDLTQAALFLAAWNIAYSIAYTCTSWLHVKQQASEDEQLHLPLSAEHLLLRRMILASAVPLASALLGLLAYLALLLYYQRPYGYDYAPQSWVWNQMHQLTDPWWPQALWAGANILAGTLLVAATAMWLDLLAPNRYLRCVILLTLPVAMYFAVEKVYGHPLDYGAQPGAVVHLYPGGMGDGPMLLNYHQTRGVSLWPYLVLLAVLLITPVLFGLAPRWARWAMLLAPVALFAAFAVRKTLPESMRVPLRPLSSALFSRDSRYACALYAGHLSPPKNIRLLMYSFPSNVLFAPIHHSAEPVEPQHVKIPEEPRYPYNSSGHAGAAAQAAYQEADAAWQKTYARQIKQNADMDEAYSKASDAYEKQKDNWPRARLWLTAGLYPLLLPLWAAAGLLLGVRLRGRASL